MPNMSPDKNQVRPELDAGGGRKTFAVICMVMVAAVGAGVVRGGIAGARPPAGVVAGR